MGNLHYNWMLKKANFTKDKGKVFSCFSCGGGSTMGYKLAGYDVIGCNEIDPKMMEVYIKNHKPKYSFLMPIQEFKNLPDLPEDLFDLEILDGSPPCSSFSTGGNREKDWGKEKKFKEGQAKQVLDILFFDFIDLAKRLQPKIVIAENVEGLMLGKAKKYVIKIYEEFEKAGYYCQHFLLDGSKMGVPQERKRVFFVAVRKDIGVNLLEVKDMFTENVKIDMDFNEPAINFGQIQQKKVKREALSLGYGKYWDKADWRGVYDERSRGGKKFGFFRKALKNRPLATIMGGNVFAIEEKKELLTTKELSLCQTFPLDYDFLDLKPQYVLGMSVPPLMTAKVIDRVYNQILKK